MFQFYDQRGGFFRTFERRRIRPYPTVAVSAARQNSARGGMATLKTPEFLEEAKKNKWEIKPVGGDELDGLTKEVAKPSTEVIERLKLLLGD